MRSTHSVRTGQRAGEISLPRMEIVVLGEDGRVTLPSEIRRALKIEIGEKVLWTLENDRACLKKASG